MNGFYVESFGAISEKNLFPGMWLRTVVTEIRNDELLKTPSDDFIIIGDQGLRDVQFEYYVLESEYRIYVAFMVNDYAGNQTIKWPEDAVRIRAKPAKTTMVAAKTNFATQIQMIADLSTVNPSSYMISMLRSVRRKAMGCLGMMSWTKLRQTRLSSVLSAKISWAS